jgi:hypothetical protein
MKICGKCGVELRCAKTGLTLHDDNFDEYSRHQADLHLCPVCKAITIIRAVGEYFDENGGVPACTILAADAGICWEPSFVAKIDAVYGIKLCK